MVDAGQRDAGWGEVRTDRGWVEAAVYFADLEPDVVTLWVFGDDYDAGDGVAGRVASGGEDLSLVLVAEWTIGIGLSVT